MNTPITRRSFLERSATLGAALAAAPVLSRLTAAELPSNRIRVGVMGLSRGMSHVAGYLALPGVEVAYVCDVDSRRRDHGLTVVQQAQKAPCQGITDFRRILDDPTIDAISIAAPSFWHTTAATMACAAGKHVYVEKPGSYDPQEAEWIVAAAHKHKRVMQMGAQRRSQDYCIEAMAKLHAGTIGQVRFCRTYIMNNRRTIGIGTHPAVPEWLDYELWQGPAPRRPYQTNVIHNNWHLFWHYDGGELANNGVHMLDVARWGMRVDTPKKVTSTGNRYRFRDDQETPDTGSATYDFGDSGIELVWSANHPQAADGLPICAFYGDGGSISIFEDNKRGPKVTDMRASYAINDLSGKLIEKHEGHFSDVTHFSNFVETIRGKEKLKLDIVEGQKTAMLCHLGKIAHLSGRAVTFDPAKGKSSLTPEQQKYWSREYDPKWHPVV